MRLTFFEYKAEDSSVVNSENCSTTPRYLGYYLECKELLSLSWVERHCRKLRRKGVNFSLCLNRKKYIFIVRISNPSWSFWSKDGPPFLQLPKPQTTTMDRLRLSIQQQSLRMRVRLSKWKRKNSPFHIQLFNQIPLLCSPKRVNLLTALNENYIALKNVY